MAQKGKIQLNYVIVAPADQVSEGDRLWTSHAQWMERTHHRGGDKALLSYNVSKAPELSNPMDAGSKPTGATVYILNEIYDGEAGVQDHFQQAQSGWEDFPALGKWLEKCKLYGSPAARIFNSLW